MMMRRLRTSTALAGVLGAALWFTAADATMQQATPAGANAATPRTPDGKVDFSGVWVNTGGGGDLKPDESGNVTVLSRGRPCHPGQECKPAINFERDSGVRQRFAYGTNVPLYKPEYWAKVEYNDVHGNFVDPEVNCYPDGLPRIGAPSKIVQTRDELIMLYASHNQFRVVRLDKTEHDPIRSLDLTYFGDSITRWEGDTLVIETIGFTDESWLGWPGYIHSNNMKIIERVSRNGNQLNWQFEVHDPEVLMQPWIMVPQRRTLNPNPKAMLLEDLPCEARDNKHIVTRERG
jgi:hypothetical protein